MPTNPLPFGEILAGPMLAMIQADTIAAQASAEFIENVGFVNGTQNGNFGQMRMITFTYQKQNIGEPAETITLKVPLLSLIPIPLLQVREAEIDFGVEIIDMQSSGPAQSHLRTASGNLSYLDGNRTAMDVILREQRDTHIQMKMKVHFAQADIPSGLSRLLQVMDNSLLSTTNTNSNNGGGGIIIPPPPPPDEAPPDTPPSN